MSNALALELTQSGAQHLQNGNVHQALKDLIVAHDKMTKAVREDPSPDNRGFYGITCLNLALVYQMMQDFESFREFVRAGIGVLEELLPERETMETLLYLASMNLQLGQVEETEENYADAEAAYLKAISYQTRVAELVEDPDAKEYALQTLSQEKLLLTALYQKMADEEKYIAALEETVGQGLGMGDVKLVGAAGLLLGLPQMILGITLGSLAGAIVHSVRMKHGADRKLAFGPYLAAGIWLSALVGQPLINAYLSLFGL